MSWLRDPALADPWAYRAAVVVDARTATPGAIQATLVVPADWDAFWTTVQSTGADIRVTAADGSTARTVELIGWSASTRSATLRWTDTAEAAGMLVRWLYWGQSEAVATHAPVTESSPRTARVCLEAPTSALVVRPEALDATLPRATVAKATGERIRVWLDWDALLARRAAPYAASLRLAEVAGVTLLDATDGGESAAGIVVPSATVVVGDAFVGIDLEGGTDGSTYLVLVRILTSDSHTLECRLRLIVRDVVED